MFDLILLIASQEFSNIHVIDINSVYPIVRDFTNAPDFDLNTTLGQSPFRSNPTQNWEKSQNGLSDIIKELEPDNEYWEWNGLLIIRDAPVEEDIEQEK